MSIGYSLFALFYVYGDRHDSHVRQLSFPTRLSFDLLYIAGQSPRSSARSGPAARSNSTRASWTCPPIRRCSSSASPVKAAAEPPETAAVEQGGDQHPRARGIDQPHRPGAVMDQRPAEPAGEEEIGDEIGRAHV